MNENINLSELLQGHEGEEFYSPAFGVGKLLEIRKSLGIGKLPLPILIKFSDACELHFSPKGKLSAYGERMLFPSKDQRDWWKWARETQSTKIPKTWDAFISTTEDTPEENYGVANVTWADGKDYSFTNHDNPIEKAALALLKVHKLIEVGYGDNIGGNKNPLTYYTAGITSTLIIKTPQQYEHPSDITSLRPFLFKDKDSAIEFLSHPENIQLIRDFYML